LRVSGQPKRAWAWLLRGLAALALAGCAAAPAAQSVPAPAPAPAPATPALWKLADSDTTIYLFGTFHLLPENYPWRSARLDSALAGSDELVTEIGDPGDPMAAAQALATLGLSPGLPPLIERVPEDKKDALRQMIAESGIPAAALDRFETWSAALSLVGVMVKRLGISPQAGVERGLTESYRGSGKPINGLESVAEQFGFFDSLSEEAQRQFLVAILDDSGEMRRLFARMMKAWSTGDVDSIAETFNDDVNVSPELRERLLKQRNARWADWLARRMERPGTIFVAVGAGHLAGPDSVQAMLKARGLEARRIQ
jgi:uncharacterized protein YbaP (TraB family)